jgi:hypothetical protein
VNRRGKYACTDEAYSVTAKSFATSSLAMALRALVRQTTKAKPKAALQWWRDARRAYGAIPKVFPTALFPLDEGRLPRIP